MPESSVCYLGDGLYCCVCRHFICSVPLTLVFGFAAAGVAFVVHLGRHCTLGTCLLAAFRYGFALLAGYPLYTRFVYLCSCCLFHYALTVRLSLWFFLGALCAAASRGALCALLLSAPDKI